MAASLNFSIRHYREADFSGALEIVNAARAAINDLPLYSEARFRAWLDDPDWDVGRYVLVAESPRHGIVGYAESDPIGEPGEQILRTACYVHPDFRGRGVGRALLDAQRGQAEVLMAEAGGQRVILGARTFLRDEQTVALLEDYGMRRVRTFYEMQRDLRQPIPRPEVPEGLALRAWSARRADRALHAASQEAFADHWEFRAEPYSTWEHRMQAGDFQPEHSVVAWEGDEIAGGAINEMIVERRADARCHILFVRRGWRKRGLGRALLLASMARARELGHESIGLRVDADNLTGAVRLYEAVGFSVDSAVAIYQRDL